MDDNQEVLNEFLIETHEGLDRMEQDLVSLEKKPGDREAIFSIFRVIHTIKGSSSFLAMHKLETVTHEGESLLTLVRDGAVRMDAAVTTGLLDLVDAVREILAAIETDGTEGAGEYTDLAGRLNRLQTAAAAKPAAPVPAAAPAPIAAAPAKAPEPAPKAVPAPAAAPAAKAPSDEAESVEDSSSGKAVGSTLRIDVELLDRLMNMVGELVLARNRVLQYVGTNGESGFQAATQRLNLVTSELQEGMMKTRMQPLANIWNRFPRMVRDLGLSCGKKVRVEMDGKETEVDKTIIEALRDPMIHMLRNAADHGVETPEIRAAAGKPEEGVLRLRAYHEGGQVIIEIMDDGAGIDPARVRRKAVEKGLVTPAAAERMSEEEVVRLVFLPGFSTNETVTNLSGRGVGMDVVKAGIERIGGTVDLRSELGKGCIVRLKIPLTLAIIPALVVRVGAEIFAIPQVNLLELVRLGGTGDDALERVHGATVFRLRGKLLPVVKLGAELGLESGASSQLVVLKAEDHEFGVLVDQILDTEEIVVKPLSKQLKMLGVYTGATIMGDGRVALILDILGLARHARVMGEAVDRRSAGSRVEAAAAEVSDKKSMLMVKIGKNARAAVPLESVDRLEVFEASAIEHAGPRLVVQYRGAILTLMDPAPLLGEAPGAVGEQTCVVVLRLNGHLSGLIVSRILDVVEAAPPPQADTARRGTLGSVVLQGQVTELLDLETLLGDSNLKKEADHVLSVR